MSASTVVAAPEVLDRLDISVVAAITISTQQFQVADVVVGLLYLPETELAACLAVEPCRRDELIEQVRRETAGQALELLD